MKINHLKDGGVEIINGDAVMELTSGQKWELYRNLKHNNDIEVLIDCISNFAGWNFEKTKEGVISDNDLLDDILEDIEYENVDICDEDELYWIIERYCDTEIDDDEDE